MFFNVCDGIFLNYCITKEKLAQSREKALSSGRQRDVYVGLDVFGRGTPGGGGFNLRNVCTSCSFLIIIILPLVRKGVSSGWYQEA